MECDALLIDDTSRTDTYPYIEIEEHDANVGHEASVSKVGEEQLFYLTSRGIPEDEAMAMIVRGFIEAHRQGAALSNTQSNSTGLSSWKWKGSVG